MGRGVTHTPLFWSVRGKHDRIVAGAKDYNDGQPICKCEGPDGPANAAMIARAVNSHQELLAALKGLFKHCVMVRKHWEGENSAQEARDAVERAKVAIASVF